MKLGFGNIVILHCETQETVVSDQDQDGEDFFSKKNILDSNQLKPTKFTSMWLSFEELNNRSIIVKTNFFEMIDH